MRGVGGSIPPLTTSRTPSDLEGLNNCVRADPSAAEVGLACQLGCQPSGSSLSHSAPAMSRAASLFSSGATWLQAFIVSW